MKYILRDRSIPGNPQIGYAMLDDGGGSKLLNLAQTGHLGIYPEMSEERRAQIALGQAENEAALENPQEALERQSKEAEQQASALPEGEYELEDLKPRQLKAICKELGLKDYGNKETLIERIRKHKEQIADESLGAVEPHEDDTADLDALTDDELREYAAAFDVDTEGTREELIARIVAAAAAAENDDTTEPDSE